MSKTIETVLLTYALAAMAAGFVSLGGGAVIVAILVFWLGGAVASFAVLVLLNLDQLRD